MTPAEVTSSSPPILHPDVRYVIDGGALIHKLPWQRGNTYNEIVKMYVQYVTRKYKQATVVFDGYSSSPSTKDSVHLRRKGGVSAQDVIFVENNTLSIKKKNCFYPAMKTNNSLSIVLAVI